MTWFSSASNVWPSLRTIGDRRSQREPVDRRAAAPRLLRQIAVEGKSKRDFARDDQVVEQRVSVAHGQAVLRNQIAEEFQAAFLAHFPDQREEPFLLFRFDRDPPLPARLKQIPERFRQLLRRNPVGVVRLHENVDAGPGPLAMGRDGLGNQLPLVRRADFLKQAFAVQELHFRRGVVHHVRLETAGARLGHRAPQDVAFARAPDVDLDAVAALELRDEADQVLLREGRVQR